jgi:hypothetical protein
MNPDKNVFSANDDRDNKNLKGSPRPQSLAKAQQIVGEQIASDISLADELIAERRNEARREIGRKR